MQRGVRGLDACLHERGWFGGGDMSAGPTTAMSPAPTAADTGVTAYAMGLSSAAGGWLLCPVVPAIQCCRPVM